MFGCQFSSEVDWVKVVALTGKKGQPPVLWEGVPQTSQRDIEQAIVRNPSIVQWLYKQNYVKNRRAFVRIQLDGYRGGKRVESHALEQVRFMLTGRRSAKFAHDEVVLRAFDLTERVLEILADLVKDRDFVIGRLVDRGLKASSQPPAAEGAAKPPAQTSLLESLPELLRMAQTLRSFKE